MEDQEPRAPSPTSAGMVVLRRQGPGAEARQGRPAQQARGAGLERRAPPRRAPRARRADGTFRPAPRGQQRGRISEGRGRGR